jgi:hypothetical protein
MHVICAQLHAVLQGWQLMNELDQRHFACNKDQSSSCGLVNVALVQQS